MLEEIFSLKNPVYGRANIWNEISDLANKKYAVHIERDMLHNVHLNALFKAITTQLNVQVSRRLDKLSFGEPDLIKPEEIISMLPKVKDYCLSDQVTLQGSLVSDSLYSLNSILYNARKKNG